MALSKPQLPILQRGHPLARGLELAVLAYEGGGVLARDASGWRRNFSFNGNVSWVLPRRIDFPGASGDFIDTPALDGPFLDGITLVWGGTIDTGGAFRHFMGKHAGGGGTNNPFDYRTSSATTPVVHLIRANAGGFKDWLGSAVTLGEFKQYTVVAPTNIEDAPTFYIDAASTTGTDGGGTGSGAATGSGANVRIGARADNAVLMDGTMEYAFAFSRQLSAGEVRALAADPFQAFRPRRVTLAALLAAQATDQPAAMMMGWP